MDNLARVRRVSRVLTGLSVFFLVAIPIGLGALWATFDLWVPRGLTVLGMKLPETPLPSPMPVVSLALGFVISMIPGGLTMFALWNLRALFRLYARARLFTGENARRLQRFALAVLLLGALNPVCGAMISVALTFTNPPGQRVLSVTLDGSDMTTVFVGCVFLVIAWIMEEGRQLADEQAQIV